MAKNFEKGMCVSPSVDLEIVKKSESTHEFISSCSSRMSPAVDAQVIRSSMVKLVKEKRSKAKKVKFFRNGDKYFSGLLYVISTERVRSFDALLEDLTRVLTDKVSFPKGIRFIFSIIDGKDKITSLEQFIEGGCYVCSSNDHYIKHNYLNNEKPAWVVTKRFESDTFKGESSEQSRESREFIKPKIVNIFRNGVKPRKCFRILLNKKTAHSFEQVLTDITHAIKLDSGAVRKVFTISGKEVSLDIFI